MKKIILISMIFIAARGFCFAEGNEIVKQDTLIEKNNMKTVIYFHPFLTLTSFSIAMDNLVNNWNENPPIFLYLTIEKPLSLSNSLIIKPSAWVNVSKISMYKSNYEVDNLRLGCDIGLRNYDKKGEGFYAQGQVGLFCIHNLSEKYNNFGADIMGYFGWSWKFSTLSIFFDIGLGCGYGTNPIVAPKKFTTLADTNFGVGFKL